MSLPIVATLLACAQLPGQTTPAPAADLPTRADTNLQRRVDSVVRTTLASRSIPGAAVAVLHRDTLLLARGYGVADRERGTSVTAHTVFQLASTTKPFTAMVVLQLAEEGRLQLDAPAVRFLDWLPERYAAVTLRQLLTHTGGVAPDMRRENVDEIPFEEFRRRFTERPASFEAGTQWQYANAGYTLLAAVVERVTGDAFGAVLRRRIFEPLGMTRTGYRVPVTGAATHAVGYELADGALQRAQHVFSGWGNSGMESTVLDLARWAAALERGALLRPDSYRTMYAPARLGSGAEVRFPFGGAPESSYGLGWFLSSHRGAPLLTHGGAIAGFSSIVNRFPGERLTVIVLSNGKQGADRLGQADAIARAIADAMGVGRAR